MNWHELTNIEQLGALNEQSNTDPVLIFKHSTRCSISNMALSRVERDWKPEYVKNIKPYYLDLLNHRDVSNQIAARYNIEHQSPQVLLISKGKCIYSRTHSEINLKEILETTAAI